MIALFISYEIWELQKENIVKGRGVLVRIRGYMEYSHQQIFDFRRITNVKYYFTGILTFQI
jgi:hypothetical protein